MIISVVNNLLEKESKQLSQVDVNCFSPTEISIIEESINQQKGKNISFSGRYLWY